MKSILDQEWKLLSVCSLMISPFETREHVAGCPHRMPLFTYLRIPIAHLLMAAMFWSARPANAQTPQQQWKTPVAGATKVNPKDGLTYIWISPGAFMMGCSPGDDECFDDEKPPHEVTITTGFWIGQTLVTQVAYLRLTGTNPSRFKGEQLPVENVNWDEAQNYCRTLGMHLPTEAEWEYAARAGSRSARYGDLDATAWFSGNSGLQRVDGGAMYRSDPKNYENNLIAKGNQTHEIGKKLANAWKLYDMLGNVWEWTADWFDKNYYLHSEGRDPRGPSSGSLRALRGGAWDDDARNIRLSNRYSLAPGSRNFYAGFRCIGE